MRAEQAGSFPNTCKHLWFLFVRLCILQGRCSPNLTLSDAWTVLQVSKKKKHFQMQPCTVTPAALPTALLSVWGKRKQKVKTTFTVVISGKKSEGLYRKSLLQISFAFTSECGFLGTCPSCLPFPCHGFLLCRYHRGKAVFNWDLSSLAVNGYCHRRPTGEIKASFFQLMDP